MLEEKWRGIIGFPYYEVSNKGRVRSLFFSKPRILKPGISAKYYLSVALCKEKGSKAISKYVAELVLEAFVGPRPEGMHCLHGPKGQMNNSVENLYWGTVSRNMMDRVRDGTDNRGEKHPLHTLTEKDIRSIRELLKSGRTQKEIAGMYNLNQCTVSRIGSRRAWGWLD